MADLLHDFEAFFIAAGIVTDKYCFDSILDSPDSVVVIHEYTGHSPDPQIAGVTRAVQISAREPDAELSRTKAHALYRALDSDDGIVQLTAARWAMLVTLQPPFKIKVDQRNRTQYGFNVSVTTYSDD